MQTDQDEEDLELGSDTKVDATDKKVATDLALLDLPSDEPDGEEHFTKEKEFFSSSSETAVTFFWMLNFSAAAFASSRQRATIFQPSSL